MIHGLDLMMQPEMTYTCGWRENHFLRPATPSGCKVSHYCPFSCNAGCHEVSRCSTRDGSQGMYFTFAATKTNKAEPTLALKPRGNLTRNPCTSGSKIGQVYVFAKHLFNKKNWMRLNQKNKLPASTSSTTAFVNDVHQCTIRLLEFLKL